MVLMAANLHFAASVANFHSCEFHMVHRWLFDRLEHPLRIETGFVDLPPGPGLGLPLTPDKDIFSHR
jgi:L-alanine-DL-glutamate epimerase-like enolase superfamily enzyme